MQKIEIYVANEKSGLAHLSTELGHIFGNNVGNELGVSLKKERTSQSTICFRHCAHTLSHDIHGLDCVKYLWRHENALAALLSFQFGAQDWRLYNYWTVHELSEI